ncbi:hypothetical protein M011DRAFT_455556 [Sporormia fimetaria CBS 119925]|uniref:Uncharacterized protein n=1 Tax=Sporormia fimetaria CBS 119925 TaxID=1340428 RepID=A0A6A6VPP7_9PLEO|nr:hypothetical protein M011DRAFT_455556 [Sporormia fimetaria CBS 119925]
MLEMMRAFGHWGGRIRGKSAECDDGDVEEPTREAPPTTEDPDIIRAFGNLGDKTRDSSTECEDGNSNCEASSSEAPKSEAQNIETPTWGMGGGLSRKAYGVLLKEARAKFEETLEQCSKSQLQALTTKMFTHLPPELRTMIYTHLSVSPNPITIARTIHEGPWGTFGTNHDITSSPPSFQPLLPTSPLFNPNYTTRPFAQELTHTYYTSNTFHLNVGLGAETPAFHTFLLHDPHSLALPYTLLRNLTIHIRLERIYDRISDLDTTTPATSCWGTWSYNGPMSRSVMERERSILVTELYPRVEELLAGVRYNERLKINIIMCTAFSISEWESEPVFRAWVMKCMFANFLETVWWPVYELKGRGNLGSVRVRNTYYGNTPRKGEFVEWDVGGYWEGEAEKWHKDRSNPVCLDLEWREKWGMAKPSEWFIGGLRRKFGTDGKLEALLQKRWGMRESRLMSEEHLLTAKRGYLKDLQ